MPAKKVWELPPVEVPAPHHRELRTIYSPEQDATLVGDLTMFHCHIFAHSSSDHHTHEKSGEIMYIMTGHGRGFLGDEVFPLEPDTVFYAPPQVPHHIEATGDEAVDLIALFAPAVGTAYAKGKAAEKK